MKKLLILLTIATSLVIAPFVSTAAFSDVKPSYWATPDITSLVEKGYMNGYEDGTFKPNQLTTRAEAAAVIARTMGVSLDSDYEVQFTDVAEDHPYRKEIIKLVELGVLQDAPQFNPEAPLKRAHISKMIALAYHIEVDGKNKIQFKDLPKSYWAKDYIESLADVGVVKGKTATTFEPNSYVTRAHVAALTKRGMAFKEKIATYTVAYDYLAKDYLDTARAFKAWESKIFLLVNTIRRDYKVEPFQEDAQLTQLAIIKAQDMIVRNYFEHESPHYGHPWDMATLFDYEYTSYGENIARNFTTPEATVAAWMASPKHRENILKSNFTHLGVGIQKTKNGNFYIVQQFSSK